jgi:hypothetical protein
MDYVTRQFINLTKKLLKDFRRTFASLGVDLHHIKDAIQSIDKSYKAEQNKKAADQVAVAEVHQPKAAEHERRARGTIRRDGIRLLIEGLTLLSVSFYGYMAVRQWREQISARHQTQRAVDLAFSQFDLTKQQMIRTQAAVLSPLLTMTINQNGSEETRLQIDLMNNGHERADNAIAKVKVVERTVATDALIGKPLAVTVTSPHGLFPIQDLDTLRRLGKDINNNYSETFTMPLSDTLLKKIENADVTVEARGTITYNNGFGDTSNPFCLRYINYSSKKRNSFPYNFVDCRDFKSALASAVDARNFDQQGK